MKKFVLVILLLLLTTSALAADNYKQVAGGARYEHLGDYDTARLNKIMTTELKEFSPDTATVFPQATNAVSLYRVIYPTVVPDKNNKPVEASGLIAIPKLKQKKYPVVSFQHGTVFTKTEVPSYPEQTMETRLEIARFAGQGYIVIAADNIGKGFSEEPDSYMIKNTMAQACLDMLMASRTVCSDLNVQQGDLFLTGWSQGSWTTQVFRQRLEMLGIPIKGAATASTPTDTDLMLSSYINNPNKLDAAWLIGVFSQFITSYETNYGMLGMVSAAIRPEYQQAARDFYGKVDEVIRPYIGGTLPVEYQKQVGGAYSEAIDCGDNATHRNTFIYSVLDEKKWFDGLQVVK